MIGGMMNDPTASGTYSLYCFNVDDIEAACDRVTAHDGAVVMGPHQVPTGNRIIRASDPQGAAFVLVGPKKWQKNNPLELAIEGWNDARAARDLHHQRDALLCVRDE